MIFIAVYITWCTKVTLLITLSDDYVVMSVIWHIKLEYICSNVQAKKKLGNVKPFLILLYNYFTILFIIIIIIT